MKKYFYSADGGLEIFAVQKVRVPERCVCPECEAGMAAGAEAVELTTWDETVLVICLECKKRLVRQEE